MLLGRYCSNMKQKVILNLTILFWVCLYGSVYCQRPAVVNLGAIFSFDSVIGRVAKTAIEAAVADVNSDSRVLSGTKLNLIMEDANCSAFWGSIGAFRVIEKEVVAIIGPQSSEIGHMISEIANAVQVPLLSFAATDPTLSASQFPFFLRTTQGDTYQMAAMADLIEYYGWKEVIAIFVDDYYGRNGIAALENQLEKKMSRISYKFPLPVWFDDSQIVDFLNQSKSLSTRVYVVHVNPDPGLRIFTIAKKLQMMTSDYVWLTSDWLSTTLDSFYPKKPNSLNPIQGVVGLRPHIPKSRQTSAFLYRWKEMLHKSLITTELNVYGLYAYDTVWTIAYSIEKFIKEFGNVTFSLNDTSVDTRATDMLLGNLKVFDGGSLLQKKIMEINFTGLTGQVHFDQDRNAVGCGYDVINIDQMVIRTIGYWTSLSGFSNVPQEIYKEDRRINFRMDQKLNYVMWPGGKTKTPRGWVIASDERPLIIGVPKRASFAQFAMEMPHSHKIKGYCIDIFTESLKLVPYYVPYRFKSFGDGHSNPDYEKLVQMVADHEFDLAVGDITITTNRTKFVDFSQPFAATGLVVVAPIDKSKPSAWVFLQPFTMEMWCTIGAAFVIIGVVIWILEHRVNTDFRGPPRRQFATIFLFSFSTLYKKNKETPLTPLGRMVMVVWLFVLMVITSSYTANLTSILTVQQLSSPITGIDSLIASNLPIGYQVGGSFAYSYLTENLFIKKSRLVPLGSPEEYEIALRRGPSDGGVAAIVDELPYVRLFLSNQSDFGIIGQSFTKSGWGFAFQRDSTLAVDISTAILELSENGKLQSLQEKWFCKTGCPEERRQDAEPEKLQLISFWGLYILCGSFAISTLLLFLLRAIWQFVRYKRKQKDPSPSSSSPSSRTRHSRPIHNFIDFIDKKEETIKKMSTQHENRQPRPQTTTRR